MGPITEDMWEAALVLLGEMERQDCPCDKCHIVTDALLRVVVTYEVAAQEEVLPF